MIQDCYRPVVLHWSEMSTQDKEKSRTVFPLNSQRLKLKQLATALELP